MHTSASFIVWLETHICVGTQKVFLSSVVWKHLYALWQKSCRTKLDFNEFFADMVIWDRLRRDFSCYLNINNYINNYILGCGHRKGHFGGRESNSGPEGWEGGMRHLLDHSIWQAQSGTYHRVPTPSPLPLRVAKAGRNHLNEEIPPPHRDKRTMLQNHSKFGTCSALAPMWTPLINESAELTQGDP